MEEKRVLRVYGDRPCFRGREISKYGLEHHRVDYAALVGSFDAVLANNIRSITGWDNWELVNGEGDSYEDPETGEEGYNEFYQEYIISDEGARILKQWTNETVWYNDELNLYLWSVSHFGTAWSYVLTDIEIEKS